MNLRLNLGTQDLAYRFRVTPSCVSKVFTDIIHIMYNRMKSYIFWLQREELEMSMPMEFWKSFGVKVSIIIDCFEIFIERPSSLLARAETFSNYKHHSTVKYLILITLMEINEQWSIPSSLKKVICGTLDFFSVGIAIYLLAHSLYLHICYKRTFYK